MDKSMLEMCFYLPLSEKWEMRRIPKMRILLGDISAHKYEEIKQLLLSVTFTQ